MSDIFEKVQSFIARHSMFNGSRGVVVAVSGGPDSVALLDMLAQIAQSDDRFKFKIHVAHLNHLLRGKESVRDAEFVRSLAEKLDLPCSIDSRDVSALARSEGRGIEEIAREVRYNFLLATARRLDFDRIATGHTMNDQAETFLMRLVRGSGLRGLAGMRAVTSAPHFPRTEANNAKDDKYQADLSSLPVMLVRPMLSIKREEVEEYCRQLELIYRTDSSNLEMNYSRNRIRHQLLPVLRQLNPRAVEAIARTSAIAASEQDALSIVVESLMNEAVVEKRLGDEGEAYSITALLAQGIALRRRIIIEALRKAQSHNESDSSEIELRHLEEIEHLLEEGRSGSRVTLPGRIDVWREFDSIVFLRRRIENESYEIEIDTERCIAEVAGLRIKLMRDQSADSLNSLIEQAKKERESGGRNWMMVVLDDERLDEKLIVRTRREGERAEVSGHGKTKKLKKLMIGHRIAPSRRNLWPVVATVDGKYVWSPGLPPASTFAPHNKSRRLAIMQASEI